MTLASSDHQAQLTMAGQFLHPDTACAIPAVAIQQFDPATGTFIRKASSFREVRRNQETGGNPRHRRSRSMRVRKSPSTLGPDDAGYQDDYDTDEESDGGRRRCGSVPSRQHLRPVPGQDASGANKVSAYRVRSFELNAKGSIVHRVDSFKSRSQCSLNSSTCSVGNRSRLSSCASRGSSTAGGAPHSAATSPTGPPHHHHHHHHHSTAAQRGAVVQPPYRVIMAGSIGVGKSALKAQFMTSEYMNGYDPETEAEDEDLDGDGTHRSQTVTVSLADEESDMIFVEVPYTGEPVHPALNEPAHAFLVVYSVTDRVSFQRAVDLVYWVRQHHRKPDAAAVPPAVILVGNKSDVVRARVISTHDGMHAATACRVKFIETSAGLNHKVDDLLVGVLTQIRLRERAPSGLSVKPAKDARRVGSIRKAKGLLDRVFHRKETLSKSCDNLLIL